MVMVELSVVYLSGTLLNSLEGLDGLGSLESLEGLVQTKLSKLTSKLLSKLIQINEASRISH